MLSWIAIGTVEICVLLLIVAAAILAAAMNNTHIQQIETVLVAGVISDSTSTSNSHEVTFFITDSLDLVIKRSLLPSQPSHASLALTIKGQDICIEERIVTSNEADNGIQQEATFIISSLKPRTRYHIHYNSQLQNIHGTFGIITDAGYRGLCILKF